MADVRGYREDDDGGVDSFIRLSKQSHWLWVIDVFSDSVSHPISAFVDSLLAGASPFQSLIGLLIRQRRKTMDNSRSTDGEKDNRFVLYRVKQHRSGPPIFGVPSEKRLEHLGSDSQNGGVGCKAGNQACPSLEEIGNSSSKVMPCDVCCTEPRFCRECRCILCCKTVSYSYGNYSFIKCETVVKGNYICGHIAHVECALRTYMAGTVGGSIGLDAEYYCRRCDARTDLVPHVTRLLKTCESVSSRTTVENILNVGFRVLRNSEKSSAKRLFRRIGFALEKLKTGTSLDEIWRAEDMPTVTEGPPIFGVPSDKRLEHLGSDSQNGGVGCKAGNQTCPSLEEIGNSSSKVMPCDVCCSEPRFCRECSCILCCKTVSYSYGNYSFIKCEAVVKGNYICGHIAHVECALRAYMAGTVGGCTGLDAEYYCRRCDARTDLVPHVTRLLKTCESISSRTNVEIILDVGFRVLRNSEKSSAKRVFRRIGFALEKLKTGTSLDEIWRAEDMSTVTEDCGEAAPNRRGFLELEALKLETEIEEVLQALKKAQECEYKTAEEKLHAQKHYILRMHQQLDKDRSELSRGICSNPDWLFESLMDRSEFSGDIYSNPDWLFEALMVRLGQLKTETEKLRDMKEVAKGFGRTSKDILKNYFDVQTD